MDVRCCLLLYGAALAGPLAMHMQQLHSGGVRSEHRCGIWAWQLRLCRLCSGNGFGEGGAAHLKEAISNNKTITSLDLYGEQLLIWMCDAALLLYGAALAGPLAMHMQQLHSGGVRSEHRCGTWAWQLRLCRLCSGNDFGEGTRDDLGAIWKSTGRDRGLLL